MRRLFALAGNDLDGLVAVVKKLPYQQTLGALPFVPALERDLLLRKPKLYVRTGIGA